MRFILLRHGNTFGPMDTVVYAGKTNDLPPKDEQDVLTGKWPKYNGDFRKRV